MRDVKLATVGHAGDRPQQSYRSYYVVNLTKGGVDGINIFPFGVLGLGAFLKFAGRSQVEYLIWQIDSGTFSYGPT